MSFSCNQGTNLVSFSWPDAKSVLFHDRKYLNTFFCLADLSSQFVWSMFIIKELVD